jgi:hypothetical protein
LDQINDETGLFAISLALSKLIAPLLPNLGLSEFEIACNHELAIITRISSEENVVYSKLFELYNKCPDNSNCNELLLGVGTFETFTYRLYPEYIVYHILQNFSNM